MTKVDEAFFRTLPSVEHHRPEVLLWYARGSLTSDFKWMVEHHLNLCDRCRKQLEMIRAPLDL